MSNLKQIGLAFRMFSNDNGERFPWQVPSQAGGSGVAASATAAVTAPGCNPAIFRAIEKELNAPKVLACTTDGASSKASSWVEIGARTPNNTTTSTDPVDPANQTGGNDKISYFVGLDAEETRPQTILSGDRNLKSSARSTNGVLFLKSGDTLEWTKELHNKVGNFGFGDGSAQPINSPAAASKQLEAALLSTTQTVHRLAFPK